MPLDNHDTPPPNRQFRDQFRVRCDEEWKKVIESAAAGQGKSFAQFIRDAATIIARRWYRNQGEPTPDALYGPYINGDEDEVRKLKEEVKKLSDKVKRERRKRIF